jgi:hypothetical protein
MAAVTDPAPDNAAAAFKSNVAVTEPDPVRDATTGDDINATSLETVDNVPP